MKRNSLLKKQLDSLYSEYDYRYLETDPLKFPRRYSNPADKEVAGLISASLAYGNVRQIHLSVERILAIMGESPSAFVRNFSPQRDARLFDSFVHRFTRGADIALLLYYLRQIYESCSSLGEFFLEGLNREDVTIERGLVSFTSRIFELDCSPFYSGGLPDSAGVRYLLSSPAKGSACKRMNLFLRWMVRCDDGLDLGLWNEAGASRLVLPLDTHTSRICRNLGLTARRDASWKTALEITARLREMDPEDPVKYDFALCRLGIVGRCMHRYNEELCGKCPLYTSCTIPEVNVHGLREDFMSAESGFS